MEVKKCLCCGEARSCEFFYKTNLSKCKLCISDYGKSYRSNPKVKSNRKKYNNNRYVKLKLYTKKVKPKKEEDFFKNIKRIAIKNEHIRNINIKLKEHRKIEIKKNKRKESLKKRLDNRRNYKEKNKFKIQISKSIRRSIKNKGFSKYSKTRDILGCDFDLFKIHIERQFVDDMSWDNYGNNGWHLDHIMPLATAKTYEDVVILNHYTNLRPLWAIDNIKKSDNIIEHQMKFPF